MEASEQPQPEPVEPIEEPVEEPENPDTEPDEDEGEDEQEGEPEPRQHIPSSLTVTEERMKAMNAAAKTHESRLKTVLGIDFDDYGVCPLCLGDAFLIAVPPGQMAPEQWDAIQFVAGQLQEENYKTADYAETCETCNGYGQVLSGSKEPSQRLIVCRPCEGKGWKAKLTEAPPVVPTYAFPTIQASAPDAPQTGSFPDAWGRPPGHRDYNKAPAAVNA